MIMVICMWWIRECIVLGLSWLLLKGLYITDAISQPVTILGWSADERYFAVRTIEIATDEEIEANQEGELEDLEPHAGVVGFCPEYIDPISKRPFRGDLTIAIYQIVSGENQRAVIQVDATPMVIYRAGTRGSEHHPCTPHREAEKNLLAAKKMMTKKGIVHHPNAHRPLTVIEQSTRDSYDFERGRPI